MTLTLFLCIFGTLTQFRNNRSYAVSHIPHIYKTVHRLCGMWDTAQFLAYARHRSIFNFPYSLVRISPIFYRSSSSESMSYAIGIDCIANKLKQC
jgi:hypothetical protein